MSNNNLGIKFSNELYATKKEVEKVMQTPLVDRIWTDIIEYRSNFNFVLPLKHLTGTSYSVCLTPKISDNLNKTERKIFTLYVKYELLKQKDKITFEKELLFLCFDYLASRYNFKEDANIYSLIISNESTTLPSNYLVLSHYYQVLNFIKNYKKSADENLFFNLYKILLGSSSDEVHYRNFEIQNSYSRVTYGKLYLGIPVNAIEKSINNLIEFINDESLNPLIRAISSLYFVYYVKPFEFYSEEIAILIFKYVLDKADIGYLACLIDFENIIKNEGEFEKVLLESQRTFDITYVLDYSIKKIDTLLSNVSNIIEVFKAKSIKGSLNSANVETTDLITSPVSSINPNNPGTNINYKQNLAINNMPGGLNEEDAIKLENHLLEYEPNLSRHQAHFYAYHCTVGMKYTIAEFKKEIGCAYETARTSMDNLVILGFYRKEAFKNKYVYTPVKKK